MSASSSTLRRLAPVALVAVLAASCGDNDKSAGTTAAAPPPSNTTGSETGPTGYGPQTRKNVLFLDTSGRDLYPLLGGDLAKLAPTQVRGRSTRVIALAGPDGFWAGRSESERILVKLRLKGEQPPKIRVGQKADFVGLLTESTGDAGVTDDRGRSLLDKQGAYVDASVGDVKLR